MKNSLITLVVVIELVSVPLLMYLLSTYTSLTTLPILAAGFFTSLGSSILFMYVMHKTGF